MEQHLLDTLSKFSTSDLLILVTGYSVGKITTYLVAAAKSASKRRLQVLEREVERLRKDLENANRQGHKVD